MVSKKNKRNNYKKRTIKQRGGNPDVYNKLISYINEIKGNTQCNTDNGNINECKVPDSKSDQMIRICEKSVFKGPRESYRTKIKVYDDFIRVDAHTMNLLVQTAIKSLNNKNIEQYENICLSDGYSYALEGLAYKLPVNVTCIKDKCDKMAHSVEDYIKIINDNISQITDTEQLNVLIEKESTQIFEWINSIMDSLDFLFNKIQFHHCDPKAAQLFLNNKQVIVGDLDKVTFTMKIDETLYRMCLSSTLSLLSAKVRGSEPEKMRFETSPRQTNLYEKTCFVTSILLLLNDKLQVNVMARINNSDKISFLTNFILIDKLQENSKKPFKEKKGHRIASECVNLNSTNLNSQFGI
jgi:hypothetical protein